jgi:hypothetical protein
MTSMTATHANAAIVASSATFAARRFARECAFTSAATAPTSPTRGSEFRTAAVIAALNSARNTSGRLTLRARRVAVVVRCV